MIVSELIADLNTLQPPACEPSAALALVSARVFDGEDEKSKTNNSKDNDIDKDLDRAKDLLSLHSSVKLAHRDSTDQELNNARAAVQRVLDAL